MPDAFWELVKNGEEVLRKERDVIPEKNRP